MKYVTRLGKGIVSAALLGSAVYGMTSLMAPSAMAGPGGPLCGFSTLWDCTMPDGSHRTVGGTRCDISKFEKSTGAHCVPSGL